MKIANHTSLWDRTVVGLERGVAATWEGKARTRGQVFMTPTKLRSYTFKDLAQMAKRKGVTGWHSMRKEELVRALVKEAKRDARGQRTGRRAVARSTPKQEHQVAASNGHRSRDTAASERPRTAVQKKMHQLHAKLEARKNLAAQPNRNGSGQRTDRLVVMVRDPYWLHAYWELTQQSIDRAQSAMGQNWHTADPVLRVIRLTDDCGTTLERQIAIHGGVNNWYIEVQEPPSCYRLEIGYQAKSGNFHCLARSNSVTTPPLGTNDALDENWVDVAENADRIFAMSGGYSPQGTSLELQELLEERLQRPMGSPMQTRFGDGASRVLTQPEELTFAIDAELIVYGASHRQAHVTVKGEPVQVGEDGTFAVRLNLPDRRQVIPVVASSPDGVQQRTIILAVERNTKVLEARHRDPGLGVSGS